ncbi:MAG: hypothetical protein K2N79_01335 [Muribaculaceae bacterium]|nr:hypothetical protein [Muribaculaceae bacterium]MDE7369018.1 hypothetical protein [Muribaculaceae bacterium]
MSKYSFNYIFDINGNWKAALGEMLTKVEKCLIVFNQASQYFGNLENTLNGIIAPGAELNYKLAELAAIANPTAEELALVEKSARETANFNKVYFYFT